MATVGFPVGDASAPTDNFGWSGEPNADGSVFTPWFSSTPLTATRQRVPGALGDTGTEWLAPYSVFIAGVDRTQTEMLADRVAETLQAQARVTITAGSQTWRVQKFERTAVGSINRIGAALPDHFTQNDNYELWLSKEN